MHKPNRIVAAVAAMLALSRANKFAKSIAATTAHSPSLILPRQYVKMDWRAQPGWRAEARAHRYRKREQRRRANRRATV